MKHRRLLAALVAVALLSSCSGPGNWFGLGDKKSDARITVAAALYPLAEAVARVGGEHVNVLNLTPAGKDAHDVELTAKQLNALESSSAVFWIGSDFQPSIQKAVGSLKKPVTVDVLDHVSTVTVDQLDGGVGPQFFAGGSTTTVAPAGGAAVDPHVWLDPENMARIAEKVRDVLSGLLPGLSSEFAANTAAYTAEIDAVDDLITAVRWDPATRVVHCTHQRIVATHQGLVYLLRRGGMSLLPIAGVNPDEQVSAKRMEEIAAMISTGESGIAPTVLLEEFLPETVARAVAEMAGASTAVVNPLEGLSAADIGAGRTWTSVMRDNISTIKTAMGCS